MIFNIIIFFINFSLNFKFWFNNLIKKWSGFGVIYNCMSLKVCVIFRFINTFWATVITRIEIKLYGLWNIWVITFFGHNCHFVQNSFIIFNGILIQNFQFHTKCERKTVAVEVFSWKISNFWWNFCLKCLWPKIVISDFLCEIIPRCNRRGWRGWSSMMFRYWNLLRWC